MAIPPKLQRFVDEELTRSQAMAESTIQLTLEQLQQPREGMLGPAARQQYQDLVLALKAHAATFQREFCSTLRTLVLADLNGLDHPRDQLGDSASGGLELMDETRVEIDIEVSRAAQLIDGSAEWELRELQTFTSTLAGLKHVSAETNPLRPLSYTRALWEASCLVTRVPVQRGILLRTAAGVISGRLKLAWAAACSRLEEQGVEPGIYRTVVIAPGAPATRPPTYDMTQPGALENLRSTMPTGPAADAGRAPVPAAAPRSRSPSGPNPAFDQALTRLEELLRNALAAHGPTTQSGAQLAEHRASLLASTHETVDKQIVELLSRLFEAVLSDPRLAPGFRAVMARLQVSALRAALVDPGMLDAHDHPVWRLMNRIGLASETYINSSDPRMAALLAYCEALVDDMARAPVQDALLYRHSLGRLDSFLGEQLREQQLRAQPAADALARAERRDELERQLAQRLTEQMVNIRTSAVIRRFVTGAWAKVLAEAMLQFGEKAEPTLGYVKAVDELLWSLRLPDHPQSRKRLLALLPGLLQRLRAGMALIHLPEAEQQPFLDELMAVHTEALRPGKGTPEAELTPQEIVQRLRDEAVHDTPPSRPPFADSLIDLSSMETVPADVLPAGPKAEDDPAKKVEAMAPGGRYRIFVHGRWTRVQLLWRSPRGQFFLFAGVDPGRTHSVTRRALERLAEEGLLRPLEDTTLMQRAVDGLVNKLTLAGAVA